MALLTSDIGGTKVDVALFTESDGREPALQHKKSYLAAEWQSFEDILQDFLTKKPASLNGICIAVAGPVREEPFKPTNLAWTIDLKALQRKFPSTHIFILNDLQAQAYGVDSIVPADLKILQKGVARLGTRAIIAAGTGLGEGIIAWVDGKYHALPSEGGHAAFSPTNADEIELLRFCQKRYTEGDNGGHISWERIVSGTFGFKNIYDFLRETGRGIFNQELDEQIRRHPDSGPVITEAARRGIPIAKQVIAWFLRLYGAESANLALKCLAVGGVYVAGGIAPRLLDFFDESNFLSAFQAKGRFRSLMQEIPVKIVLDKNLGLRGAAIYAREKMTSS